MHPPMSETSPGPGPSVKDLSAADILGWLRENPKFLQTHPEACAYLVPPRAAGGRGVADFQTYMIERLKADKGALEDATREIVENSRANMNNQTRIHRAVLMLLEARSFEDFIHTATLDLSALLDVDIVALVVESDGRVLPHIHKTGLRIVPPGTIDTWMKGKTSLLQNDIGGIEAIYGGGAPLVASQALVRVDVSTPIPPAILAFGSRDPNLFDPGQATDQVSFLARVVERCLRAWLDVP